MAMFEPRKLRVNYRIERKTGEVLDFDLRLDEHGLLEDLPDTGPEWTRIDGNRCLGCKSLCKYCRASIAIVPVVEACLTIDSLEVVHTRVTMGQRITEVRGPISQPIASLMGLCMAASGCSTTAPFRAMAVYHLPFATLEETVIRAAGFALLGHWAHGTLADENPFARLTEAWSELEEMNMRIGRRLQSCCETDATLNGLINLDMFAKSGGFGLESALKALRPALLATESG
jgi:hypothetical protein